MNLTGTAPHSYEIHMRFSAVQAPFFGAASHGHFALCDPVQANCTAFAIWGADKFVLTPQRIADTMQLQCGAEMLRDRCVSRTHV